MTVTLIDTIILSFVQGITEFLPISSSGHLVLMPHFFGFTDPGLAFSAGLHFGTLGAVIAYFWRDIVRFVRALFDVSVQIDGIPGRTYIIALIIATLPAAIAGALFEKSIEGILRSPTVVMWLIFIGSVLLWRVDRYRRKSARALHTLTYKDALWFGVLQAVAIIPGISRSGMTIMAGRALGFSRHSATRFSFLMAIPIVAGATFLEVPDVVAHGLTVQLLIGMAIAFLTAYATIAFFLHFIERIPFAVFIVYSALLIGLTSLL